MDTALQAERLIGWETDAEKIDPRQAEKLLYRNARVNEFLDLNNKFFIAAGKGIGKTLLLKSKRYKLENRYQNADDPRIHSPSVMFIPRDDPYLDSLLDLAYLSQNKIDFYKNWRNTKTLWTSALQLAVLSYHAHRHDDPEILKLVSSDLPGPIRCALQEENTPCRFAAEYFRLGISEFQKTCSRTQAAINTLFSRRVRSGVCIFIDRLDQALLEYPDLWFSVQAGLIEAAWDLMRRNTHVRVYCTIRQEAFANYESPNKLAITGEVSFIQYFKQELCYLLDTLVRFYEQSDSFKQFIGCERLRCLSALEQEDLFDYVLRHTLSRPRDLVQIASYLSPEKRQSQLHPGSEQLTVEQVRYTVNKAAKEGIAKNIFSENEFALECLGNKEQREDFFSLVGMNVLTLSHLRQICHALNSKDLENDTTICKGTPCRSCDLLHPFCELHNIGLLGSVGPAEFINHDHNPAQVFLEPHEFRGRAIHSLPARSPVYVLHPCLNHYIREIRNDRRGEDYTIIEHVIVGHGQRWTDRHLLAYALQLLRATECDETSRLELRTILDEFDQAEESRIEQVLHSTMKRRRDRDRADPDLSIIETLLSTRSLGPGPAPE